MSDDGVNIEADDKPLSKEPIPLHDLPSPESLLEEGIPEMSPAFGSASGGIVDAATRIIKGIPPCIWVLNRHSMSIRVVVSQFKPCRILTQVGLNSSSSAGSGGGGGRGFHAQLYYNPATTKSIPPGKSARFPLWSKLNDYGVISIIREDSEECIKNDWVPAGATAVFTADEELLLYNFKGKLVGPKAWEGLGLEQLE